MIGTVSLRDVERFRAAILHRLGLTFDDAKLGFLSEVAQRRLEKLKQPIDDYLHGLEKGVSNAELSPLAEELTVTETYFFRNIEQFRAFEEIVVPARMDAQNVSKTLRFLSAGCASGEEAYSIAIVVRETIVDPSWQISIRAADMNPVALAKARRARYSAWALRETPLSVQKKWMRGEDREMILDDRIRTAVTFEERNLASDEFELWQPAVYDAIFCRNVSMYFSPEQARALISRVARSLAPGGYLFLGHAETLRGLSNDFHLRHTHGTFYYERTDGPLRPHPRWEQVAQTTFAASPPDVAITDAWVDVIRGASERVEALIPGHAAPGRPAAAPPPEWDLGDALGLLRSERFSDALVSVHEMPPAAERDADTLLLKATLLAHSGEVVAAEEACRRLLSIDELNAGAQYILALCRESSGDRDGAIEFDRVAVYLDPTFAMPRLHMGLLARRAGDRDLARRELEQALALLDHEDPARLLLFGGGFNRQALIALCGSALRDCGGRP